MLGAPLRVAQVIWSLGLGGAEQVVIRLAAGLDRTRFEPLVCCLDDPGPFAPQAEKAGLEVVALGKRGPVDVRVAARLGRLLRGRGIDVVHTHLWGGDLWGRLVAHWCGTPVTVTTAHNVDDWKQWHHLALDRWLARGTTRLVAVSEQVRAFYEGRGVAPGRWQVVYNGVADVPSSPRGRGPAFRELGIGDEPLVGLVGRLVSAKAPDVFLDAVARASVAVPTLKALVVGDGPLRSSLEQRISRMGLQGRVVFTGVRHDVADLFPGLDALASSSEREGLSMAMLEAMAAGVPVVATRVGGTPELIESGITGILVPPGDPQALADGLLALLRSPERSESLRRAARERVRSHFSLSRMVERYQEAYSERPVTRGGRSAAPHRA